MPGKIPPGETRGWIIPIGGAENKENDRAILERFLNVSGGKNANIVGIGLDEDTAARHALAWARSGDVLALPLHSSAARAQVIELLHAP
jgi:cyanophycinase-like exopeptidase